MCDECDRAVSDDITELKMKLVMAREFAKRVFETRAFTAGALAGVPGLVKVEVEFPGDADILHVYQVTFGRRAEEPAVYRLSFGKQLKWVGVSQGLKLKDIVVGDLPQ